MNPQRENYLKMLREYHDEREKYVEPKIRRSFELGKLAQEWALLGIKNAFIANAAAAGAIPIVERIFITNNANQNLPGLDIVSALWWFGGGIIFAAITCLFAYVNFNAHSESIAFDIADDLHRLAHTHFGEEYSDEDRKENQEGESKADRRITWTYLSAIMTGVLSYVFFGIGVYTAIPG